MEDQIYNSLYWSVLQYGVDLTDTSKSDMERKYLLDNILTLLNNRLGLIASMIGLHSDRHQFNFRHSLGLPIEQCDFILRKFKTFSNQDGNAIEEYTLSFTPDVQVAALRQELSEVTMVSKLNIVSNFNIEFTMFSDHAIDVNTDLQMIDTVMKAICNAYFATFQISVMEQRGKHEIEAFEESPSPILLMDRQMNILKINEQGAMLLGKPSLHSVFNLKNFIITENTLEYDIGGIGETIMRYYRQVLRLPIHSVYQVDKIKVDLLVKAVSPETVVVSMIINDQDKTKQLQQSLLDSSNSLSSELSNYAMLFKEAREEAIEYGLSTFFPASFAFTINEKSGPIVLSSSPDIDHDLIFEDTIKLMASLNSYQIVEQGYLTGVNPWTQPSGELRWIAFSRQNRYARGGLEIHLIGLVTKTSLLMLKPEIANTLLGLLLGTMNRFIETLSEDNADFVTLPFAHDRNFSTLSILKQQMLELRMDSSEILAVYS